MSGLLRPASFPFSAIYKMDLVKKALLCSIVNPRIKAVLIKGASGTGKTVIARSLSGNVSGKEIVNVPLNVTDEQLFGCLDIEIAISEGRIELQEGLMNRAHGNFLYMDDVNLFEPKMLSSVMDAVMSTRVKVERENMSTSYDCDTTLVATMNVDDSYINPRTMDCFDLCATVDYPNDEKSRKEILRRNLEFNEDPDAFAAKYAEEEKELLAKLVRAKEIMKNIRLGEDHIYMIAEICSRMKIDGLRGDLSMMNASMALAALDGRSEVGVSDIEEAATISLFHRRKPVKRSKKETKEKEYTIVSSGTESDLRRLTRDDITELLDAEEEKPREEIIPVEGETQQWKIQEVDDVVSKIGETFNAIDLFESGRGKAHGAAEESGKRAFMRSNSRSGKYVSSRITDAKNPDMAFDATVRAAAPYQIKRHIANPDALSVIIEKQDLREKVREVKTSSTFLFAVDTSGSLIIRNRMMAVKGAILSLLKKHYVKKDRVGFMTFNEEAITMLLPPTKSVECIYKLLDELPVGKRTPLSAALLYINDYMTTYVRKRKEDRCFVIFVTDGNANVALDPDDEETDAVEEALEIAKRIQIPNTQWVVIDSEKAYTMTHNAERLAKNLRARYYTLEDLKE